MGIRLRDAFSLPDRIPGLCDPPRLPGDRRDPGADREAAVRRPVRHDLWLLVRAACALKQDRSAPASGRGTRAQGGRRGDRDDAGAQRPRRRARGRREGLSHPERRRHNTLRSRAADRAAGEERPLRGAALGGEESGRCGRGRGQARRPLRASAHVHRGGPGPLEPRGRGAPPWGRLGVPACRRPPAPPRVLGRRRRVRAAVLHRRAPEGAARGDERRRPLRRL